MTTPENVLYASTARPWLKYYAQKYIDQTLPTCSAFDYVCQQNKNRLGEAALNYYGRKFTYADFIVNVKKTAAALRGVGVKKGDWVQHRFANRQASDTGIASVSVEAYAADDEVSLIIRNNHPSAAADISNMEMEVLARATI